MQHTGIGEHFDRTTSSHQLKLAKENPGFWVSLKQVEHYDPARTLLIDDSIPVLRRAGQEGIGHLLSIHRPDSQRGPVARQEFHQVEDFQHIHCTDLRGELPAAVSKTSIDITSDDRPDYGTNYGTKKQR